MKARFSALRILAWVWFVLVFIFPAKRVSGASPLWQSLAPGIQYREFYLPAPNHLYVARMERDNPQVILESSLGQGVLSAGGETVREQAARYDQAIGYWGQEWGMRNQVVVAINGSFYNTETGVPWSGQIQSGWYVKRFEDRQKSSGFVWTLDRQAFVGGCVVHRPGKQLVTLIQRDKTVAFNGINVPRGEDDLIIYTPQYGAAAPGQEDGMLALVELERPLTITPSPDMVMGVVREVIEGPGLMDIPFDAIVLSAGGKAFQELKGKVKVGDQIGVSQELRHLAPNCQTEAAASWTNAYASVSGSYIFLDNGVIQGIDELGAVLRNPRTAIALDERYVYFIVVDGRDRLRSVGMSMAELADFAKTMLGATWGIAQDGGGSSTMVVNGEVKNNPNADLVELQKPPSILQPTPTGPPPSQGPQKLERAVANGMMMVVVQPRKLSTQFKAGDQVTVVDAGQVNLRLGPGTNFAVLNVVSPGAQGVVLEHPLNGVLAKGYYWWKIDFGGLVGWLNEASLGSIP
jgi:hypothetical protein